MWDKLTALKDKLLNSSDGPLSKRNIVALLLIGIGLLSVPLGVDLVQTQTNLKSQAADLGTACTSQECCQLQMKNETDGIPIVPAQCSNEDPDDPPGNEVCAWAGYQTYDQLRTFMDQQGWQGDKNNKCSVLAAFNGFKKFPGKCVARVQEEILKTGGNVSVDGWGRNKTVALQIAKERGVRVGAVDDRGTNLVAGGRLTITDPAGISSQVSNGGLYKPQRTGTYNLVASDGNGQTRCEANATLQVTNNCASACSICIVKSKTPHFLVTYVEGGWGDASCDKYNRIVDNWCTSVSPSECQQVKATTCAAACAPGATNPPDDPGGSGGAALPTDSTPQTGARGSATCSNQTANLSWSGFTAPVGTTITNYTLRLNKSPFDWAPTESCSETAATRGDCTLQAGSVTTKNLKLSDGTYGFSVQPGFSNGSVGQTVNLPEFSCGGLGVAPAPGVTAQSVPQPPTGLRALAICDGGNVTLRWKRSEGATGYIVKVNGVEVPVNIPSDPLIRPEATFRTQRGQSYSWTVQSVNSAGTSAPVTGNQFSCNT